MLKDKSNASLNSITSVQQANGALFDDVIDVLQNGATNVDAVSISDIQFTMMLKTLLEL